MDTKQVAEEFLAAFKSRDMKKCRSYLADGFTFSGPVPKPASADQWIGIMSGMQAAFPDLNYNIKITGYDGNKAMSTTQLTGTHTADWDLSALGMGVIPATGKHFSNPEEKGVMTIENGKIASFVIDAKEDSGVPGILKKIGVQMPV
jgi:ketosteroid isomerase-like protein